MKLVEILARELKEWPSRVLFIDQSADGDLIINYNMTDDGYKYIGVHGLADDWIEAKVTRPQWQAERERIIGMETQQATASVEPSYEQQLWDKAYLAAWMKSLDDVFQQQDYEVFLRATSGAAKMADDFMSERAKRLHKQN